MLADPEQRWPGLRTVFLPERGGIDRDMALSVEHARGDYCWLFSGDDVMLPGALARVLDELDRGPDLVLLRHENGTFDLQFISEYPLLTLDQDAAFDLADPAARRDYCARAFNSEAFFSFMSGLVVRREVWNRVPFNPDFDRSCWGHVARLFELIRQAEQQGWPFRLRYLERPLLRRRGDNDSFLERGIVHRYRIAVEGYHRLADTFFGHDSIEAWHVRRVIRREIRFWYFLTARLACQARPELESRATLDRLAAMNFADPGWRNQFLLLAYHGFPLSLYAVLRGWRNRVRNWWIRRQRTVAG